MAARFIRFDAVFFGLVLCVAMPVISSAKPLTSKACVQLVGEFDTLTRGGIKKSLASNPASARSTIKAEQLKRIERFLYIESQIRFRCPKVKFPELKITPPSKGAPPSKVKTAKLEKKQGRPRGPGLSLPRRNPSR